MQRMLITIIVAFLAMLALGPALIPVLKRLKFGQTIRDDGPKSHAVKQGTPTMGGLMMIIAFAAVALLLSPSQGRLTLMLPAVLFAVGFGLIGLLDDWIKVVKKRSLGLKPMQKIILQFVLSLALALYCYFSPAIGSKVLVPFVNIWWDLGVFYIPFAMFVIIATVNSANLIDGLDGLCAGVTSIMMLTMTLIALFMKSSGWDEAVSTNVMVFSAAMAGACLGFLRFNTYPARIFMGDTGSFALGGAFVAASLILRLPLLIPLVGAMYLASSLSDIIQVVSYKTRHKRVFRMAPLHHHFELGGTPETKIVAMYMLVTAILCLVALLALGIQ